MRIKVWVGSLIKLLVGSHGIRNIDFITSALRLLFYTYSNTNIMTMLFLDNNSAVAAI